MNDIEPCDKAVLAVVTFYNDLSTTPTGAEISPEQVHLVWFCKVLENWKAILITDLRDKIMYEVTYSGKNRNTHIDAYTKFDHARIGDETEWWVFPTDDTSTQAPVLDYNGGDIEDMQTRVRSFEDMQTRVRSFEDVHGPEVGHAKQEATVDVAPFMEFREVHGEN